MSLFAVSLDSNVNFQTLAGLRTAIENRLDRTFDDDDINDFIYLAERELERVLTVPYREISDTIVISGATYNLPSGFKALRRLTLLSDPKRNLQQVPPAVLDSNWPDSATDTPEAFSIIGTTLYLAPTPDATYNANIVYEEAITPLTDANPSNWLFQRHPDAYFYGALVQAADFIEEPNKINRYRAMFDAVVEQINREGLRYRYSAMPLRLRSPVSA